VTEKEGTGARGREEGRGEGGKEVKREREVRGKGRGYAGARKMVCPGARVGSRRACASAPEYRLGVLCEQAL